MLSYTNICNVCKIFAQDILEFALKLIVFCKRPGKIFVTSFLAICKQQ